LVVGQILEYVVMVWIWYRTLWMPSVAYWCIWKYTLWHWWKVAVRNVEIHCNCRHYRYCQTLFFRCIVILQFSYLKNLLHFILVDFCCYQNSYQSIGTY